MNKKLWIVISVVIVAAVVVTALILLQPSAEDILVQAIETAQTIDDGHIVMAISMDSIERDGYGMIEVWARGDKEDHGAFRVEVLESSEEKAVGAIIVSDGETLWAYSPSENKVFVGTAEDAQAMIEESEFMTGEFMPGEFMPGGFGELHMHKDGEHKDHHKDGDHHDGEHKYEDHQEGESMEDHHEGGEHDEGEHMEEHHADGDSKDGHHSHPESAEEVVEMLKEFVTFKKSGREKMAGENAQLIIIEPIPEQMPSEYTAVGGLINLWVGRDSKLPLGIAYTGGSLGEFNVTVLELEINAGIDDALFTFDIPADAEIVTFADLEPQSLTIEEAGTAAEFELLTPGETPEGATLVDIVEVRGALVQRYTLPEGGSFTVAQGLIGETSEGFGNSTAESQTVDVRGTTGKLFESQTGDQVLLTWTEGDLFFSVAGNLSAEDALAIAESLE
ncbi:MAG: DUF4367 domain-containing protein [Anaerolineales bacterium]|nr:DUF4367 domain-containing protein [Chloroflexota bacterium]MBL6980885.1 DUF4367 domain-containing protein [Anaerolineales bacterium]